MLIGLEVDDWASAAQSIPSLSAETELNDVRGRLGYAFAISISISIAIAIAIAVAVATPRDRPEGRKHRRYLKLESDLAVTRRERRWRL